MLYNTQGVQSDATPSEIRHAYHRLSKFYHPDKCDPSEKELAKKYFNELQAAYSILEDPQKRSIHDLMGNHGLELYDEYKNEFLYLDPNTKDQQKFLEELKAKLLEIEYNESMIRHLNHHSTNKIKIGCSIIGHTIINRNRLPLTQWPRGRVNGSSFQTQLDSKYCNAEVTYGDQEGRTNLTLNARYKTSIQIRRNQQPQQADDANTGDTEDNRIKVINLELLQNILDPMRSLLYVKFRWRKLDQNFSFGMGPRNLPYVQYTVKKSDGNRIQMGSVGMHANGVIPLNWNSSFAGNVSPNVLWLMKFYGDFNKCFIHNNFTYKRTENLHFQLKQVISFLQKFF